MAHRRSPVPVSAAPAPPALVPAAEPGISARPLKVLLTIVLAVFVVLAGMYLHTTPAGTAEQHNPDENAHILYVASVAGGNLPVFHAGFPDYEAHQPPLYYLLCAPVYAVVHAAGGDLAETMRAVRGVSVVLGALLVWVAFAAIRALFPGRPLLALGTAAFVAFLPMNVSLSASVSNDTLTNLLFALVLWRLALIARDATPLAAAPGLLRRQSVILGVLLGAGIWTKSSTLLLLPVVAGACYFFAKGLLPAKNAARLAGISLGLGILIGLPWLLRNQVLYGDPLAQHIFETAFQNTAQAPDLIRFVYGGSFGAYLWGVARWTFASFWGVFDSMQLFWGQSPAGDPPSPAQPLFLIYDVIALCCLGAGLGLWLFCRRAPGLALPQKAMLGAFALLVALAGLAHLRFILVFFQAQGRYWYPALVPLAAFFVLGLRGLSWRPIVFPILLLIMTVGLLALNAYTLGFLFPARFLH